MQKDGSEDHDEEKERALKNGVEEESKEAIEDINEDHNEEEGGKGALKKDVEEEEEEKQVEKVKDIKMINSDSLLYIYFPYRMHVCLDFHIFEDANMFFCCFFAMFFQSSHIKSYLFCTLIAICLFCT